MKTTGNISSESALAACSLLVSSAAMKLMPAKAMPNTPESKRMSSKPSDAGHERGAEQQAHAEDDPAMNAGLEEQRHHLAREDRAARDGRGAQLVEVAGAVLHQHP